MRGFFRRLTARPLRSGLTLAQVVLSTLAVTAALSAFRSTSIGSVPPERFDLVAATQGERTTRRYALFEPSDLGELAALTPAVAVLSLKYNLDLPTVEIGEDVYEFRSGAAVDSDFFDLRDVDVISGTPFTRQEVRLGEQVALVSEDAAAVLFPSGNAVGSEFRLRPQRTPYRVVGVFHRAHDPAGPALYVPLSSNASRFSALNVLALPGQAGEARQQLLLAARNVYAANLTALGVAAGDGFQWSAPGQEDADRDATRLNHVIFAAFAFITLVVSSIGAFSLLTVNAMERQRDVGLRRAMGETRAAVIRSFALEAAAIGLLGGVIGVVLTALILPLLRPAAGSAAVGEGALSFDPVAAVTALGVVVILNALLSLMPAVQLTSAQPVQALTEA